MSSPSGSNFPPPNSDQYYHPSNPRSYSIGTTPDDSTRSQRPQYPPASNVPVTTPPQLNAAPPNLPPTTPPQLRGVPQNSLQLHTSLSDYGARPGQHLPSPPYTAGQRPPSQDGRNPYFPDSAGHPDYRGMNGQATPIHNGPQSGPNSYQPPSTVSPPRQFSWPTSPPNIASQPPHNSQMAAHPHPQERGFSLPHGYLQPPPASHFPNHPSIVGIGQRRSHEDLAVQNQARSLDHLSISAPNPSIFESLQRSPPTQTETPRNVYTRFAQNNQPNVAPSSHTNISINGQNGYSNTPQNGQSNILQTGSNIPPNGHSNIVYHGPSNGVPNGMSNIARNGIPHVVPNGQGQNDQSNIPQNNQPNIVYHGQQNTTLNRNRSIGSTRARNNSESELPAGVFRTTWDWIANNFYGISETITPLGQGSYGKVFEVLDLNSRLKYAMKIMEDTEKQREEVKTVQQLCTGTNSKRSHPHIVHVFKTMRIKDLEDKKSTRLAIQMELCAGSLFKLLSDAKSKQKNLEANTILFILIEILDGLHYCHSRNIIHRDLKPQNVLYVDRGCVCHPEHFERSFLLTDFGFAKPCLEDNGVSSAKHGSNCYRSPELMKENQYSEKSDIWAFGCVVMEVASSGKQVAFTDDYLARKYNEGAKGFDLPQLMREDNTALDESSIRYFNSLVKSCLQRDPKLRPSAKELLENLMMR